MELVDNTVIALIPGAMDAGLVNPTFRVGLVVALSAAFVAAYPVNLWLLGRGKGHALTHDYHGAEAASGWRRFVPTMATSTLLVGILAFALGGLLVALAACPRPVTTISRRRAGTPIGRHSGLLPQRDRATDRGDLDASGQPSGTEDPAEVMGEPRRRR